MEACRRASGAAHDYETGAEARRFFIRLFFTKNHHASTGSRTSRLANARGVAAPTASTVPIVFEALSRLARNAAWFSRAAPANPLATPRPPSPGRPRRD